MCQEGSVQQIAYLASCSLTPLRGDPQRERSQCSVFPEVSSGGVPGGSEHPGLGGSRVCAGDTGRRPRCGAPRQGRAGRSAGFDHVTSHCPCTTMPSCPLRHPRGVELHTSPIATPQVQDQGSRERLLVCRSLLWSHRDSL